ncbi:MAG: hypothetical protein HN382_02050 [Gammaproteobacteria bacterium]|jgi:hypothetical protein|nr:hypothetical protein [Gammaproteobacteria bacterium]MBT4606865.1 hypothetical protein [Thiotrichales bacterium]MBT3967408.1 hypothetical protein [Gammaproteobacteria bacterium]MBT4081528.1 hypothetical protein [Gammaproteobacteria bacterium]MBT4330093.1 hypothetical protein [Gammaproteobacteria bacterium]
MKGMKNRGWAAMAVVVGLLSGCSSVPKPGTPEFTQYNKEQKEEERVEVMEEAPDWFMEPPKDGDYLYEAATALSSDLQMSIDKAVMDGKTNLADRLNGKMSGQIQRYIEESGEVENREFVQQMERVSKSLFTDVNTSGYRITEKKLMKVRDGYRTFVLIEYPLGEANQVLVEGVKSNQRVHAKLRASKAFAALEDEIVAARSH